MLEVVKGTADRSSLWSKCDRDVSCRKKGSGRRDSVGGWSRDEVRGWCEVVCGGLSCGLLAKFSNT